MKSVKILILLLLCLHVSMVAQVSLLDQRVDIDYKEEALAHVLNDLSGRYRISFSYVNNVIPLHRKITVTARNVTLQEGLKAIFGDTEIDFSQVNDQIVLRKKATSKQPHAARSNPSGVRKEKNSEEDNALASAKIYQTAPYSDTRKHQSSTQNNENELQDYSFATKRFSEGSPELLHGAKLVSEQKFQAEGDWTEEDLAGINNEFEQPELNEVRDLESIAAKGSDSEAAIVQSELSYTAAMGEKPKFLSSTNEEKERRSFWQVMEEKVKKEKLYGFGNKHSEDKNSEPLFTDEFDYDEAILRPVHIGLAFPLSTNGLDAPRLVNRLSFHGFMGLSKGIDGTEFSGFGNVTKDFVRGVQGAGFFNVTGGVVKGVQMAGFVNVNSGNLSGVQAAGFVNVSAGNAEAVSLAGFVNVREGKLDGVEMAGFMNLSGNVDGFQAAGFMNIAKDADGAQIAGFVNIAEDIEGAQIAGFVNIAKRVKGTQIGFINIADSVDGIPIGIFNIVKHGYRRLEVFASEGFHSNVVYKMGVQRFYSIFAVGAQFNQEIIWGYGFGFGSQFPIGQSWRMSIDATGYNIVEPQFSEGWFNRGSDRYFVIMDYINSNNNLRIGFDKEFSRHFTLTFGPSWNVLVRSKYNKHGDVTESAFVPYSLYEIQGRKRDVIMWPGFFVGLRF